MVLSSSSVNAVGRLAGWALQGPPQVSSLSDLPHHSVGIPPPDQEGHWGGGQDLPPSWCPQRIPAVSEPQSSHV